MNYLTNLNLNRNELQNAVIHRVSDFPAAAVLGQIIFLTSDENLYVYKADGWQRLDKFPGVDGGTVVLNKEGKLAVAGIEDAIASNPDGVAGFQPILTIDGEIIWTKPDTTTIEGMSTSIKSVQDSVSRLNEDTIHLSERIDAFGNDGTDGNSKTGIFAELEQHDSDISKNAQDIVQLKEQVDGIQQNVQGDFEQTDETAQDYIKNKPTKLSQFENDSQFITNTVDNLVNYYTKTDVNAIIANTPKISMQFVDVLPEGEGIKDIIYMVPKVNTLGENVYNEYVWTDKGYELIGDTAVSLDGYATEDYVAAQIEPLNTAIQQILTSLEEAQELINDIDDRVTSLEEKTHATIKVATIQAGQTSVEIAGVENVISMYATDANGERVLIDWLRNGANHIFSIDQPYDLNIQITLVYLI